MVRELAVKYMPCYCCGLDAMHFAIVFCLNDDEVSANSHTGKISSIMDNILEALLKYYNVSFKYGIGHAVRYPMNVYESCRIARDSLKKILSSENELYSDDDAGNHIVRSVKKYIKEHVREKLTLNDVSENFGISPNYLSQLFSKFNDCGFSEYINLCKIKESKTLLQSGSYKVYEVADMCGFDSSFYFSKVFKKCEGISPSDYINSL